MKYKTHSREFKLSVLAELQDKTIAQVSKKHNVHPSLIRRWRTEYRESPSKSFSGNGKVWKMEAKLAEKDRLIGQLYAENEFLKKTAEKLKQLRLEEAKMRCIK